MIKGNIGDYREEYGRQQLSKDQMTEDPLIQFQKWFDEADQAGIIEPNTMTLATVGKNGQPSIRVVLLKEITDNGLIFFTNYQSRKGQELKDHPLAALNFYWQFLERQVRVEGKVIKISSEQSDLYFQSRPRGSQISAWVSAQSETIPSRAYLDKQLEVYQERFKDQDIPRPPHWGGYHLKPHQMEFWQGGAHRMHDRMQYTVSKNGWELRRLAP